MIALVGSLALLLAAGGLQEPPPPTPEPDATTAAPVPTPSPESEAAEPVAPAPVPTPSGETEYQVGAGDVLDVLVLGNADASRAATIQPSGSIRLPLLGEVMVAGLTTTEVQRKLTSLLARDYLVDPQVEVKVKDYQSQFVFVMGEVNQPGRKPLRGRTRLIDALVEAGGFTPQASGEVVITRSGGFGENQDRLTIRLSGANPTTQDYVNLEVPLRSGDILSASRKQYVTVEGEVTRPNRYTIDGQLTLSGAVSLAGGLTRFGSQNVKVRRTDPRTGDVTILEFSLKDIGNAKIKDPILEPNDVVTVSRRFF